MLTWERRGVAPRLLYFGKWRLHVIWATKPVDTNQTRTGDKFLELVPCKTGAWTDWVAHIRFSWEDDGLIELYKDGVPFTTLKGPNTYNDKRGTYFKLGVYKWGWMPKNDYGLSTTSTRIIYYDEVRIGDA